MEGQKAIRYFCEERVYAGCERSCSLGPGEDKLKEKKTLLEAAAILSKRGQQALAEKVSKASQGS